MKRNACRNPWVNEIDLTIAQNLGWRVPEHPGAVRHRELRQPAEQELGPSGVLEPGLDVRPDLQRDGRAGADGNKLPDGRDEQRAGAGHLHVRSELQVVRRDNASSNYRMQLSMRYSF